MGSQQIQQNNINLDYEPARLLRSHEVLLDNLQYMSLYWAAPIHRAINDQ